MQYLTLELPKRIINDAIGAQASQIVTFGFALTQIQFLALLCLAFLLSVIVFGLLKMRINTMKGVLSERMLRRFRYTLIVRIFRFPQPYFQRTSQGELVSMITSESEPLGGIMGDALAQPVLQTGQMITILSFLFLQNIWFGLASIALIPLQAWLIPKMQGQINKLNHQRIKQVRQLAAEIGESAGGASTLRTNGGWRYRKALISDRLGRLFDIRFRIYQKKFFMKFLNNFINQLTPLFFFSIGGYLVIKGSVSLGALVAALAAYKDLSDPWKELLQYYNGVQDMSLRWNVITERFAPSGMVSEALLEDSGAEIPHLSGEIIVEDVTVRDEDGNAVLEDINLRFPKAGTIAIASDSEEDRRAMAALLTRELRPARGNVTMNGHDLSTMHQSVLASRIGHANSRPYVFDGTVGDNIMMPLRAQPQPRPDAAELKGREAESLRAGNSADTLAADWLDPKRGGLETVEEVRNWWMTLVEGMGSGNSLFRRGLEQYLEQERHGDLAKRITELRPSIAERIAKSGLSNLYYPFDPASYCPVIPMGGNLLFATPRRGISQSELAADKDFLRLLRDLKLEKDVLTVAQEVVGILRQTFGIDGTEHPLFRKLGIDPEVYEQSVTLAASSRDKGAASLKETELALLLTVPFRIPAELIGPALSKDLKAQIIALRIENPSLLENRLPALFTPLDRREYAFDLTILENAIFGKISSTAGHKADALRESVAGILMDAGLKTLVAELILDVPTGLAGANLSALFTERLAFSRAAIKRPDIMVLDRSLANHDPISRMTASAKLREALPDTTLIYLEDGFETPESFDVFVQLEQGRIKDSKTGRAGSVDNVASTDLAEKLRALRTADLFAEIDLRQLRLLAFSARWFTAPAGDVVFRRGDDPADGAYLILEGEGGLYFPHKGADAELIAPVGPGTLVGELALIRSDRRRLDLRAHSELKALRIGTEEFLAVVENDATTAFRLLQAVSSYLSLAADNANSAREQRPKT